MDITAFEYATKDQFINLAHGIVGKPALIIAFISVIVSYWVACFVVNHGEARTKKQWDKLTKIFGLMIVLVAVFFCLLYFMPLLTNKIMEFFIGA